MPNQWGGRAAAGVLSVSFDTTYTRKLAHGIGREAARADKAILTAHEQLAMRLQKFQAQALQNRLEERGRVQRETHFLMNAIMSEKNHRRDMSGFTVGYLDEIPNVARYWRNLEQGTDIFVGRVVRGMYITATGASVPPFNSEEQKTQVDRRLHRSTDGLFFRIKRPIVGYHYLREGTDRFVAAGFAGGDGTLDTYVGAFQKSGLEFLTRFFEKTGGTKPRPSQVRFSDGGG